MKTIMRKKDLDKIIQEIFKEIEHEFPGCIPSFLPAHIAKPDIEEVDVAIDVLNVPDDLLDKVKEYCTKIKHKVDYESKLTFHFFTHNKKDTENYYKKDLEMELDARWREKNDVITNWFNMYKEQCLSKEHLLKDFSEKSMFRGYFPNRLELNEISNNKDDLENIVGIIQKILHNKHNPKLGEILAEGADDLCVKTYVPMTVSEDTDPKKIKKLGVYLKVDDYEFNFVLDKYDVKFVRISKL